MAGGGVETYLTIAELAEYLKLSGQTVRRYVLNREIPYHKIKKVIRFRVSEIETWIDGGGLNGAVTAGLEDDREGDLFACPDTAETGEAVAETAAKETGAETAGETGTTAGEEGITGGAA
jgi:excisionase family DNA binding protein